MPKSTEIKIFAVIKILEQHKIDPRIISNLAREMKNIATETSDGEKKQFVMLMSDPRGKISNKDDFCGWILQLPENESAAVVEERIRQAAYDYNASKKGQKHPVKNIGDAVQNVPAKFFRKVEISVKTKTPIWVLRTNNSLYPLTAFIL
jgi:hypothetical protein